MLGGENYMPPVPMAWTVRMHELITRLLQQFGYFGTARFPRMRFVRGGSKRSLSDFTRGCLWAMVKQQHYSPGTTPLPYESYALLHYLAEI